MALKFYALLLSLSVQLWQPGCSQSCKQDESTDAPDELARPEQGESMLQKNVLQKKTDGSNIHTQIAKVERDNRYYPDTGYPGPDTGYPGYETTTTIEPVTQPPTVAASCPDSCKTPTCVAGGSHNGGYPLVDGVCLYYCSRPFSGTRYCGLGSAYTEGDSADCSKCGTYPYVHAAEGSKSCPPGYHKLMDLEECKGGLDVVGTKYAWADGNIKCGNSWPNEGCFSYGSKLYFSTCSPAMGRPHSMHSHNGVCKKGTSEGTSEAVKCPASCYKPACQMGSKHNGGVSLSDGMCYYLCSKQYAGIRYCGSGSSYSPGDSIDCSGCASGNYIHAPEGSTSCPSGYTSVTDENECQLSITIGATHYVPTHKVACNYQWPAKGCFSYGTKLYYSTCTEHFAYLTQHSHQGICKKV